MSRCFPFPPPGYSLNKSKDEALIESIKLQRESELAKVERKREKKREKKEKKKGKKRNESHSNNDGKDSKHKSWAGQKDVHSQKPDENKHLERSSVTEEHKQPIGLPKPSSSSDSTQNSSKRKRDTSPPLVEQENVIRGHGNVIRIRLASHKNKAVDALVRSGDPCPKKQKVVDAFVKVDGPCTTLTQKAVDASIRSERPCTTGTIQLPAQRKHEVASGPVREKNLLPYLPEASLQTVVLPPSRLDERLVCSTSGRTEPVLVNDSRTVPVSKLEKKLSKAERKYRDLVENWVPPPVAMEPDFEDQDWLLPKRDPVSGVQRQPMASGGVSWCKGATDLWPRAQFLPEADIYALPFTVPF